MDYLSEKEKENQKKFYNIYNSFLRGYFETKRGDVQIKHSLDELTDSKIFYPDEIDNIILEKPQKNYTGMYIVKNMDSIKMAKILGGYDDRVLVLNFANAVKPAGGVRHGRGAQEESLCRESSLALSLEHYKAKGYYDYNKNLEDSYLGSDAIILTPTVEYPADTYHWNSSCSVITCAAPYISKLSEPLTDEAYDVLMKHRMTSIFKVAIKEGYKKIVLGAWGCGVYGHDPYKIASLFEEVLSSDANGEPLENYFDVIGFAVLSKNGHENFSKFNEVLGSKVTRSRFTFAKPMLEEFKSGYYGKDIPATKNDDGSITMGGIAYSDTISNFNRIMLQIIELEEDVDFEWYTTGGERAFKADHENEDDPDYSNVSCAEILSSIHVTIAFERFCDGATADLIESGLMYKKVKALIEKSENGEDLYNVKENNKYQTGGSV